MRNKRLFLYYLYYTTIRRVRHRKKDALIILFIFFLNFNVKDLVSGKEVRKQVDLYFFNPFLSVMQQLI